MKLKLCGIRRIEDVRMINQAAPDYAGFIFWPKSRRYISPSDAKILRVSLKRGIEPVGVFVNEEPRRIAEIAAEVRLRVIQLHGDEDEAYIRSLRSMYAGEIWKAAGVRSAEDIERACRLSADMLLFDAFNTDLRGGTGKRINLGLLKEAAPSRPYFLAGGINASNVREIIAEAAPYGIDVSSGFEVDGAKNSRRLDELMEAISNERKYSHE